MPVEDFGGTLVAMDRSRKTRALQLACGKPWRAIAREWEGNTTLSQSEVAERWTTLAREFDARVRFTQQDVSDIFREARQEAVPA